MTLFSLKNLSARKMMPDSGDQDYARLITDNLSYIERQCRKAVSQGGSHSWDAALYNEVQVDNDSDELLTELLDHLKADDYRVLRAFKGTAKITTYITTVIANLVIDLVRKKKGRSRAKERSREFGTLGERLYELVFVRGYSLSNAHGHLVLADGISENEDELRVMLERIRGREDGTVVAEWPYQGKEIEEDGEVEVIVADPARNAEELIVEGQRDSLAQRVLAELLDTLTGEERLMVRMRFPQGEDEEGKSPREIAALLGQTEKAVDNRIRRILMRCRENLLGRGLSLDDLISVGK
jgi:RNA polymerase sigma factor (sigma-70 family)